MTEANAGYTVTVTYQGVSGTLPITIAVIPPAQFIAVTGIVGAPSTAVAGIDLDLSGAEVQPSDATKNTITWTVKSAGTTGAAIDDNTLRTTGAGTVVVTATVANGKKVSTNYVDFTKDFTIKVYATAEDLPFIAVTNISGVTLTVMAGTPLELSGTVDPSDATNKAITWAVTNAGVTGARPVPSPLRRRITTWYFVSPIFIVPR
jgi:hypothetical protein